MNPLEKVIQAIASDIYMLIQQIISDSKLKNSGLSENLKVEVVRWQNLVINIVFDDYVEYIENGRVAQKGKLPPVDALRDWALKHSIPTDNKTLWAIAKGIQKNGVSSRPILSRIEAQIDEGFENKWADMLFDAIVEEVEKSFFSS